MHKVPECHCLAFCHPPNLHKNYAKVHPTMDFWKRWKRFAKMETRKKKREAWVKKVEERRQQGVKSIRRTCECEVCQRDDCGQCVHCKDMPRYNGMNRLKQRCRGRACLGQGLLNTTDTNTRSATAAPMVMQAGKHGYVEREEGVGDKVENNNSMEIDSDTEAAEVEADVDDKKVKDNGEKDEEYFNAMGNAGAARVEPQVVEDNQNGKTAAKAIKEIKVEVGDLSSDSEEDLVAVAARRHLRLVERDQGGREPHREEGDEGHYQDGETGQGESGSEDSQAGVIYTRALGHPHPKDL